MVQRVRNVEKQKVLKSTQAKNSKKKGVNRKKGYKTPKKMQKWKNGRYKRSKNCRRV